MSPKRILAVCRDNWIRSPAVEDFLRGYNVKADSCGVGYLSYIFGKHFSQVDLGSYDLILAADKKVFDKLIDSKVSPNKLKNLRIPNVYWRFIPFRFFMFRPERELDFVIPNKIGKILGSL